MLFFPVSLYRVSPSIENDIRVKISLRVDIENGKFARTRAAAFSIFGRRYNYRELRTER